MKTLRNLAGALLLVGGVTAWLPAGQAKLTFEKAAKPVLDKYCLSCHKGSSAPGGFDFAALKTQADALRFPGVWGRVRDAMANKRMPPEGMPQPSATETANLTKWIGQTFQPGECDVREPGRVTLRRLNRAEYDNTIRDLTGLDLDLSADFPSDDVGNGFDNIGDVLSLSPLLAEKYLDAAEAVMAKAIRIPAPRATLIDLDSLKIKSNANTFEGYVGFYTNNEAYAVYRAAALGEYKLRLKAWSTPAGNEPAKMAFLVDGKTVATVPVTASRSKPEDYEVPVRLTVGTHQIGFAFVNDFYEPQAPDPNHRDRNLYIVSFQVTAPADGETRTDFQRRFVPYAPIPADEGRTAREAIREFLSFAYRRPARTDEVERLGKLFDTSRREGNPWERGLQLAYTAALVSPNFLFRVELDQPTIKVRPLTAHELASRLSYFLHSSMPDMQLKDAADAGMFNSREALRAHALRLLKSPRAVALTENFAGQWLQLRNLGDLTRDQKHFPEFDEALKRDMAEETSRLFAEVVSQDLSVIRLLDADYTFVNERLAKLYGLAGVTGPEFRKVSLKGTGRAGLLTQASILTVTANPTRTSPVKRGKWVLEEILGSPPPPAPPGVGNLSEERAAITGKTLRQRMEQHRKDPSCAVCHTKMDAYGLAFENYDAIGRWRTQDEGLPIDASGTLPGNQKFQDLNGLRAILLKDKDRFVRTLTEKLLTYALGRGLTPADACAVDDIVKAAKVADYKFSSLVLGIVTSEPFTKRQSVIP